MKRTIFTISIILNVILLCILSSIIQSKEFCNKHGDIYPFVSYQSLGNTQSIRGWTNCIKKLNIKTDVAFFGNSLTRNSDFSKYFPDKDIINLGEGGDNIEDMLHRIDMIEATHPDKIFIMAGINHSKNLNIEYFSNQFENLIDSIRTRNKNAKIYCQSILPLSHIAENTKHYTDNQHILLMNSKIKSICERKSIDYIDIFVEYYVNGELPLEWTVGDGIHITNSKYSIWADKISTFINE